MIPAAGVLAGLITLALAIASDDTVPDGAPAQGAANTDFQWSPATPMLS